MYGKINEDDFYTLHHGMGHILLFDLSTSTISLSCKLCFPTQKYPSFGPFRFRYIYDTCDLVYL